MSLTIRSERSELTEEAHQTIKTIKQMESSLEDQAPNDAYKLVDEDLKVTIPLTKCLQGLKEKHNTIAKIHRERFEQVTSEIYNNLGESALRCYRTRTGARVLFFPSRAIIYSDHITAYIKHFIASSNFRPFTIIYHISRQRVYPRVR